MSTWSILPFPHTLIMGTMFIAIFSNCLPPRCVTYLQIALLMRVLLKGSLYTLRWQVTPAKVLTLPCHEERTWPGYVTEHPGCPADLQWHMPSGAMAKNLSSGFRWGELSTEEMCPGSIANQADATSNETKENYFLPFPELKLCKITSLEDGACSDWFLQSRQVQVLRTLSPSVAPGSAE